MKAKSKRRSALTLIEVAASSLLTAMVLVTTLQATAVIHVSTEASNQHVELTTTGIRLLEELRGLEYAEPGSYKATLGIDDGETRADRSTWDDIDDAVGYTCRNLTRRDGSAWSVPDLQVQIDVKLVDPTTLQVTTTDNGLKRVTIRINRASSTSQSDVIQLVAMFARQAPIKHDMISLFDVEILSIDKLHQLTVFPRNGIKP